MSNSSPEQPRSTDGQSFATLSEATRHSLRVVALALFRAEQVEAVHPHILTAARCCVCDARSGNARAEQLVRELKQCWEVCSDEARLTRPVARVALELLVTESIAEFYRAPEP